MFRLVFLVCVGSVLAGGAPAEAKTVDLSGPWRLTWTEAGGSEGSQSIQVPHPGSTIVGDFQDVTTAGLPEGLEVALNRNSNDPNFGEILELSIVPEPAYGGLVFAVFAWSVLLRRPRLPGRSGAVYRS